MFWKTDFGFDEPAPDKRPNDESKSKKIKLDPTEIELSSDVDVFKVRKNSSKKDTQISWVDKYEPRSFSELVVHTKKIEELENAFRNLPGKILLLTGPSGSGKTSSLKCICKKLNIGIKEWITSLNKPTDCDMEYNERSLYTNALQDFEHFLLKCSRKRITDNQFSFDIVLIKDIPNAFITDGSLLSETFAKYLTSIKSTLVFIMNDEHLIYKLFPNTVLVQYNVTHIKFNPINDTGLVKTLQNIIKHENITVSNDTIVNIIQNCNGNLTYAINQLYFITIKQEPVTKKQNKLTVKMLKDSKRIENDVLAKNKQISFFQNIGRVLYPKKEPIAKERFHQFKNERLLYDERDLFKFKHDPNDLVEEFLARPNSSIDILQENYVSKFTNVKDLVAIASTLSMVDTLHNYNYSNQNVLNELNVQLVIRGLMNNARVVTSYAPVQKSNKYLIPNKTELNRSVQNLFGSMFPAQSSLNILFDVLSILKQAQNFMSLSLSEAQIKFIHDFYFK